MIVQTEIIGTIAVPNADFQKYTESASVIMYEDVLHNFEIGGNPTWKARKDGSPSFLGGTTGSIARELKHSSGEDYAEVSIHLPYARIHDAGGVTHPKVSEEMKAHFWKQWFASKKTDEFARRMALQKLDKKLTVKIPRRTFMKFSSDARRSLNTLLRGFLFKIEKL